MTKISKLPLRKDVLERIFNLYIETLAKLEDRQKLSNFVNDFFSPTEKIMFAKRLACAVLIAKGHDYESIHEILRISPPTIAKMSSKVKYQGKGLNSVIKDILKRQSAQIIWKELEELFDLPAKGSLRSPERYRRKYTREKEIKIIKEEF